MLNRKCSQTQNLKRIKACSGLDIVEHSIVLKYSSISSLSLATCQHVMSRTKLHKKASSKMNIECIRLKLQVVSYSCKG